MTNIKGRRSLITANQLKGWTFIACLSLLFFSQGFKAKSTVDVHVLPKLEFFFDQQQVGNENQFSFQLSHIKEFYQMNLSKVLTESVKDSSNDSSNNSEDNNTNNSPSHDTQNNNGSNNSSASECNLNIDGGDFEPVDNFEIYQNIISNILQITRSDNEYYYFYLDSQLQLYTYRVSVKKENLKYLGHKKIDFEDFILNATDPNGPLTILLNNNNGKRNLSLRKNDKLNAHYNSQNYEQSELQTERDDEYDLIDQVEEQQQQQSPEVEKRRKLADDKEESKVQQVTYVKLLQWKDQIICIINQTLYVIIQDKAYKLIKLDNLLDADSIDDYLFAAMGSEGLKLYEFQQGTAGSSQPSKDIQLKRIATIKWKDQYVRQVLSIDDRIYFVNKDSIYIYLFQGKTINFGCTISDNQLLNSKTIEKIHAYNNTLIALTSLKNPDSPNVNNKLMKGYIEYSINANSLKAAFMNGSGSSINNGNQESDGQCFTKIKEENDLPNGIRDIQIANNYILFGIENGIRGVKSGINLQYLYDITKNKWTNNFVPNISHFKMIENSPFLVVASGNRFSIYNFSDFNLNLNCSSEKLFDQGNLVTFNGVKYVRTSSVDYQIIYITNQCQEELERQTGAISQEEIEFNTFKSYFGYKESVIQEDLQFLDPTKNNNSTCIIKQKIVLKQNSINFAKNHGFLIGLVCSFTVGAIIIVSVSYFYRRRQKALSEDQTPQKKKRIVKMNNNSLSNKSDDSGIFQTTSMQKSVTKDSGSKKDNNSSTCILQQKSTKNQSAIFEDDTQNQSHSESSNNQNYFTKNKKETTTTTTNESKQLSTLEHQQQQLEQQTQQMLYISQQEQQQFIQQILQNPQFQQLSKYEQDRFLQHQYQQHLEYQKQIRLQQMKQQQHINQQIMNQKGGGRHKFVSPLQRKYGGGVDPILETDSDKKMSTRRDQDQFYRMQKRNNFFEENLIRSYQKNINVINDLNLNIQLEDNVQPPSHNVFSPQNFDKVQFEIGHDQGDVEEILTANTKQKMESEAAAKKQQQENLHTDNGQVQNPTVPYMTLQSIQNSLALLKKQDPKQKIKASKKTKLLQHKKQYQQYEDEEDEESGDDECDNHQATTEKKSESPPAQHTQENQYYNNEEEIHQNLEINGNGSHKNLQFSDDKEKSSYESEIKTADTQAISDKMSRSNNDTTSTTSNRQQKGFQNNKEGVLSKNHQLSSNQNQQIDAEEEEEGIYHNTLNDNESNQDEVQLNTNQKISETSQ